MERHAYAARGGRLTPPINRDAVSDGSMAALADQAEEVALPTVCAIVARLPNIANNAIIVIRFRMILR
jgi:hypothetical protein